MNVSKALRDRKRMNLAAIVGAWMKPWRGALLMAMALISAPVMAQAHSVGETALLKAETDRFEAEVRGDWRSVADSFGDELAYGHASGLMQTKEEYLKALRAPSIPVRGAVLSERSSRIYGKMGVTHGVAAYDIGDGKPRIARIIGVYRRQGHRWLLIAWQNTALRR
ncbi:nuclear transport factor 2 family protein [Sphingobium boeckii]|uniref:DUF4440 domain-containing protein n=1 Tax=Sphingobium boeckii TaxID=1082345 RepID=A0A7W9ALL3_9SPHN|nr:nuclear transport factor 2 family protein [Sphingobium boeckii]MBB5687761.1 hypothetical protein [Sphingobium boeckii]